MVSDPLYSKLDESGLGNCIISNTEEFGGFHILLSFKNGYGASIIKHRYSLGYEEGLYEVAPMFSSNEGLVWISEEDMPMLEDFNGESYGYLSCEEVISLCDKIKSYREHKVTPDQFYDDIIGGSSL